MDMDQLQSRVRGAWYGVFVGDALGTTLEFKPKPADRPSSGEMHREMVGGGPFGLEPGDWTDDGAMTLCLAKALAEDIPPEMNLERQLRNYLRWRDAGFCSSNGECFDIGGQTASALSHFERTGETEAPLTEHGQGNGSLMRAVPVPLWFRSRLPPQGGNIRVPIVMPDDIESVLPEGSARDVIHIQSSADPDSQESFNQRAGLYAAASATTHNNPVCSIACVIYSEMLFRVFDIPRKEDALEASRLLVDPICAKHPEFALVHDAIMGQLSWDQIDPAGWVINSLAIAFWALCEFDTFEEGMIEVVNLCGDADTNGAIFGGLAGAVYGFDAIPDRWVNQLKKKEELELSLGNLIEMK